MGADQSVEAARRPPLAYARGSNWSAGPWALSQGHDSDDGMKREIRKAAVLGAGTMGSRIAAHLANAGVERLEQAIEELKKVEEKKSKQPRGAAARVSESEPEARVQRESNGGLAAGYNAQLATGASEKIVVGVKLTNEAADVGQLEATLIVCFSILPRRETRPKRATPSFRKV